jgi:hypothetical protein
MNESLQTPVAFLIFNRPDTAVRVFEAIRAARPPKLLVVADGPRCGRVDDAELCAATRRVIETVDWPCEVLTNFAESNLGCKERVSSGLDWVFSQVEEAIILEDDCLPHPSFFRFCEEMLRRYREDDRIMMIGGTNYLKDRQDVPESYFFSRYFAIWGWATWRRAWDKYDITLSEWGKLRQTCQISTMYHQKFMQKHLTSLFDAAYAGRVNTWDIQWFYTCLFNNGLAVIPKRNLISNIGIVGTHSETTYVYNNLPVFDLYETEITHPLLVYQDGCYDSAFIADYSRVALSIKVKHLIKTVMAKCGVTSC